MEKSVRPSVISGRVIIPASKSMMQRAVAAGLLAEGTTVLHNPSNCNDALAALGLIKGLGADVLNSDDKVTIRGGFAPKTNQVHCGESGLGVRMFTPIAALHNDFITITGEGSLMNRPVSMIEEPLRACGVICETNNGLLPIKVKGPLPGGRITVDGSVSSQQLTGLLMALPMAERDSILTVVDLKSKPYIDMTLQLLDEFGITVENKNYESFRIPGKQSYLSREYWVEGDWSGASFFLVAGALAGGIKVDGVSKDSRQADRVMVEAVERAGAQLKVQDNAVWVMPGLLRAFEFDATDCPDLFPPLVALAAHCHGTSVFKGVGRLKHKESDRGIALKEEFEKLGVSIQLEGDLMKVSGGSVTEGRIHSHHDHRIAMACAVAALRAKGPVIIEAAESVNKSYPEFFDHLGRLMTGL